LTLGISDCKTSVAAEKMLILAIDKR